MPTVTPPPYTTDLVDSARRMIGRWLDWIIAPAPGGALNLLQALALCVYRPVDVLTESDLSAALSTTALIASAPEGQYRVAWYGQVITVDGVASSFQVTVNWTSAGQAQTFTGSNNNGDTLTTKESGTTGLIDVDGGSPISISTTYSSNTASKMHYKLLASLENLATSA